MVKQKKLPVRTKKVLVAILVATMSFLAGFVTKKNQEVGDFLQTITTIVGGSIVNNTDTTSYNGL